jgi:hypothetical protein
MLKLPPMAILSLLNVSRYRLRQFGRQMCPTYILECPA